MARKKEYLETRRLIPVRLDEKDYNEIKLICLKENTSFQKIVEGCLKTLLEERKQ